MTAFLNQNVDASQGLTESDLLSGEPEKRIVELQFLERLLSPQLSVEAVQLGRSVATALKDSAPSNFARMTDSAWDVALASFEQEVPVCSDFGPFRGRRERN